ncbi:MAG: methylenetetrahydrofolate reductase C-terminal domain-containing protein [Clostridiales bacterium]|jgi:methylenetetrahydrofolate reductase (NADPH)|nr:methylenetetrahydrofolate reductase C-terminal domain-containing protein [Eubacteriales bacterium]MDH7566354.1 methylenetetrahydrofolate reductase C-terminal domain-containing protein [Clostridiales bacterium]
MEEKKLSLREALTSPDTVSITWELIPGRGSFDKHQEEALKMAELAAKDPRIHGVTLTDNPGGKPAILPYALAQEIKKMGIDPLIHFTCKDKNRNSIHSDLYALERAGLNYLLVMTGDYPVEGYSSQAGKVFDIDSVQAVKMISDMNKGEEIPAGKGVTKLPPTHFFPGVVVSPFKRTEQEQVTQYYKLFKKVKMGAQFVISQIGYDPRKIEELKIFMKQNGLNVPLVGNVFLLPYGVAKMMNENKIPGCYIPDEMLWEIDKERGRYSNHKEAQLLRSAKLYAVCRGLKTDGINIGGHGLKYSDVQYIIEKGEELTKNWQDIAEEFQSLHKEGAHFYYYEKQPDSNWNTEKPVDLSKTGDKKFHLGFRMFHLLHVLVFEHGAPFHELGKAAIKLIADSPLEKPFEWFEHMLKFFGNGCRFCGDCAMVERGYVCPMSKCPKQQRNGPCGGSYNGWCEVYPNKQKCAYVLAYDRLKDCVKDADKLRRDYIPPVDGSLYKTAAWINYFTGKDFTSRPDYVRNFDELEKKGPETK